jgi:hypothetical protein
VRIHPDEDSNQLRSAGLILQAEPEHGLVMNQPCAQYCDGQCQAYTARPRQCRRFTCATLARHNTGELTIEESRKRVAILREHRRRLDQLIGRHLPDLAERPLREVFREINRLLAVRGDDAKSIQQQHGELLVHAIAFRRYRSEHFASAESTGT